MKQMERPGYAGIVVFTGILLGIFFWVLEAAVHHYIFGQEPFTAIFPDDPNEFWMRSLVVVMIVGFSFYARRVINSVTKREEKLARMKDDWEATVDSFHDPLFIHDREFRVVRCNRAYQELAGLPFDRIIGSRYFELFPRQDGPFEMCGKAIEEEEEEEEEEEICVPAINRIFRARYFRFPIKGDDGKEVFFTHVMEDVTDMKKAQEALVVSEGRYRGIVETSTDAIISINEQREITQWNRAAFKIFGYEKDEVIGRPIDIIIPEKYRDMHREGIERFLETGKGKIIGTTTELDARRKDGSIIPVDLSLSAIWQNDSWIFTGIIRDITERQKAVERLKQEIDITSHMLMIVKATASTTNIDDLMKEATHCTVRILGSDLCLFYLWDDEFKRYRPGEEYGLNTELVPLFRTVYLDDKLPFVAMAAESGAIVFAGAEGQDDKADYGIRLAYGWLDCMANCVVIPVTGKTGRLGLLVCVWLQSNTMSAVEATERDVAVMKGIADQVSIALEQVKLYREAMERNIELSHRLGIIQVMHEMDRSIISTLDSEVILETTVNLIATIIHCDRITVGLVDKERGGFVYAAGFGIATFPKGTFVPFEEAGESAMVLKTGKPVYVSNLEAIEDKLTSTEKCLLKEGYKSHIRVPLVIKGEIIGIITVGSRSLGAFTKDDLATIEKLTAQISIALEHARLVSDLEELFIGTVRALSKAIDAKSPWTMGHSERVTQTAIKTGKVMGLDDKQLRRLELAGLMHDIGKLGTSEEILNKPERLTDEELKLMKQHPVQGAEILEPIKQLKDIVPSVRYHQEFYDGTGYPEGLKGEEIPLMARILSVADTVDAMGADRPYRKGKPADAIIAEIKRCSGTQFDPKVVDAFLNIN